MPNKAEKAPMWRNTQDNYGLPQILLHWSMALMVAGLIPLGLWMTGLDYYDPWYQKAPDLHRAIGIVFAILLLVRLLWRIANPQPHLLVSGRRERQLARIAHVMLYILPACIVLSGYLLSTADGRGIDVFGWFEVAATLHGHEGQEDIAGDIHFVLAMLFLGLIALHVLAAIRHHFFLGDDTLRRMLKPLD